jgi:hypothetical protein
VRPASKDFKKKRKLATDEIVLFRQSNAQSGDRVSMALEGISRRKHVFSLA